MLGYDINKKDDKECLSLLIDIIGNQLMTFEMYCVEVANIPYYNFLTEDEHEAIAEEYVTYCKNKGIRYDEDYDDLDI